MLRLSGGLAALAAMAALAAAAQPADASRQFRVGIYDDALSLSERPAKTFAMYRALHVHILRVNLYWGGRRGVAVRKPRHPGNPRDPAYRWKAYDNVVRRAHASHIDVVFSIYGTPEWANGGRSINRPPRWFPDLTEFARAAARRYSGSFRPRNARTNLPAVKSWLAWNEPNNPVFLMPQYKRVRGRWVAQSAVAYAHICNAIYRGIHAVHVNGSRVACGVTAPRGNNDPSSSRPSIAPLAFLRATKDAGLLKFDVWAHHPYYAGPFERPGRVAVGTTRGHTAITLGNIDLLVSLVRHLYGNKRVWITEYGFQTNPPDRIFGVSFARQAKYLTQAFAIARRNPHIDMMLWFLLKDEPRVGGWQSGLLTASGKKKPAFAAFRKAAATRRR